MTFLLLTSPLSLTLPQLHRPPCCSHNSSGKSCLKAFAPAVPAAWNALPPQFFGSFSLSRSHLTGHFLGTAFSGHPDYRDSLSPFIGQPCSTPSRLLHCLHFAPVTHHGLKLPVYWLISVCLPPPPALSRMGAGGLASYQCPFWGLLLALSCNLMASTAES